MPVEYWLTKVFFQCILGCLACFSQRLLPKMLQEIYSYICNEGQSKAVAKLINFEIYREIKKRDKEKLTLSRESSAYIYSKPTMETPEQYVKYVLVS